MRHLKILRKLATLAVKKQILEPDEQWVVKLAGHVHVRISFARYHICIHLIDTSIQDL